ncbi:hypothetical protein LRH25_14390 [Ideonella azotifigens]|uniref:VCBS repeat-containing protein n=1 Tax=Ideonella azotifigens TaxID=513160 RepID=A0ABP3VEC2_9BURK|nr:hypothetical protein [Ideonella azotifigens]MCD2341529.1 hypothetical protein [Ideonella azotifigens]
MSLQRLLKPARQRLAHLAIVATLCAGNTLSMASAAAPDAEDTKAHFVPCSGADITATVSRQALSYSITLPGQASVDRSVPLDVERQPHLIVEDYNFDGRPDLSVWYLDEGMSTSTIHRVFLFDPDSHDLKEVAAQCGEEFLNLKLDKLNRLLISTVYKQGKPSICKTSLAGKQAQPTKGMAACKTSPN